MRFLLFIALAFCTGAVGAQSNKNKTTVKYPITRTDNQNDNYHGVIVADPYRWLEDDTSPEVEAWVKEQNKVTSAYLSQIPYRDALKNRITELINYPRFSAPIKAGEYYLFYKNDGLQNQPVIYIQKGLKGQPEVFIDPNKLSADGTVSVNLLGPSDDNRYMAYTQSEAGSDWQQIRVMDVSTRKPLPDVLRWVKFSGASWHKDGFFYSRYPQPAKGAERSGNNQYHSIYYHRLGEDQSRDKLVYEDKSNPDYYHYGGVTEDHKYFIMYAAPGTDGYATYYKDLQTDGPMTALFEGYANKSSVVEHIGGRFLVITDIGAPKYRLVSIDPANPAPTNWKEILPETNNLLETVSTGGGKMFASYLENATGRIYQMNYDGSDRKEIKLPGLGSAGGLGGKAGDQQLFYAFTSFVYPNTIFKYDVATGVSEPFFESPLQFNPADYVERQVFYTSKDGTKVPMFLVYKKDLKMNGKNPCYLYGYGGFNVNLTPSFSASRLALLENGGIYAMPNLRGGAEYGEAWHQAGMLLKKQNVFDDFIAAAEYLISEKYTSKGKLGIGGGSNGGLLVGACMTQRPDLFAVALPAVGVMDMLRYHLFTVGKGWIPEYGSSEDPVHFKNLYAYSPLHNLKPGVKYPATMVTTADHDDRVVPAHSFKFAAQLQKSHKGSNPVLIRIEERAGHGAGKPVSKVIEEAADTWAFFFYNTKTKIK
jgi:prolyl oligopeptidase